MALALVIFLIGLLVWRKIRTNEPWSARERWWMFALLTAGMLLKGPIVYAFLLPGIVLFQLWRRKLGSAASAWCGWWPWIASLAIFLIWVVGGIRSVPGFYDQVVMREFMGRFGETIHRPQPFYFYFPHLLHKFAPWSLLLIALAIFTRRWRTTQRSALPKITPETAWLLCWIFGGLIVMSLIPSKRVDRIFPVIPPLCLLLASQIGNASAGEPRRMRVYFWAALTLIVAVLFTGGYSAFKVFSGYREKRGALVDFSRAVRAEAAAYHWRYEVVSGGDEGLLLYLQKTRFIEPRRAVSEWNSGNLDALIVPGDEVPTYQHDLPDGSPSQLRSAPRKEERGGYVLFVRAKP
jgi:4-amino-4-deoxy-L-arabinose transferase-like glycosyltransferase